MGLALCEGGERSERIMGLLQRICLRPIVAQTDKFRQSEGDKMGH